MAMKNDYGEMSSMERVQAILDAVRELSARENCNFTSTFLPLLRVVSSTEGDPSTHNHARVTFSYTVQPQHCNLMGNMHGGAVATLFDCTTSLSMVLAPAANEGSRDDSNQAARLGLGVSRTLNVTYVRPAPCDEPVLIECEVVHAGRRMSSLRAIMRRQRDNAILSTCEHGKVIPDVKL